MYPEISQKLLRRARQGHIFHNPTTTTTGKDDKSKTAAQEAEGGFRSKKWTIVERDQEVEEPTYLAKRRKGLPPVFGAAIANLNPQTSYRTTKVKKYDADGKLHVYEVLAPEGQQVEGEIVAEDEAAQAAPVEPVAAAPGTIVEGVGVVNEHGVVVSNDLLLPTPPRRKPPPPRRKPKKGPGRGKKKVIFDGDAAAAGEGTSAGGLLNVPGIAAEQATDSAQPSSQADTPMPDAGDDDEGSGSEGEEGEDGDEGREEGELSPSPEPEKAPTTEPTSEPPAAGNEPLPAPVPTTEVKEEQKDEQDAVMADSDVAVPTSEPTLPGLAAALKSPSLPAQQTDASSAAAAPIPPVVDNIASSPDVPLATSSTAEHVPTLPGLSDTSIPPITETVGEEQSVAVLTDARPVVDTLPASVEKDEATVKEEAQNGLIAESVEGEKKEETPAA